MADIFISYKREEQSTAKKLADALQKRGWTVWWDPEIRAGERFDDVIEKALIESKCVVVLWSKLSVESQNVKDEATYALNRDKLVPILIEEVNLPFRFERISTGQLIDWDGSDKFPGFQKLIADVISILGEPPVEKEKRKREQAEREAERKLREDEQRKAEEERQRLEEEKQHLAEQKQKFEEEQKRKQAARKAEEERKQKEAEAKRKADDEKRRKEKEVLKLKSEEEERKRKEAEEKRKFEEERKRREVKAKIKTDKPKPDATATTKPKPPKPRKTSNALKFGAMAGVIVLLVVGGWFYYQYQEEQQKKETQIKLERFYEQVEELERSVEKVDNQEQLKGLYRQRDKLSDQVAAFSEQATKVGLGSQVVELQDRLKKFDTQLANIENELVAARKGKIFVASTPENATVKILNIGEPFKQGMELEPGKYHVQVSLKDYEPQDRWIELDVGEEKRIIFELTPQKAITNSIGMKFVLIPAGKFIMGSPSDEPDRETDEKQHEVNISKPFYLQTTEVSQAQWKKVIKDNPSNFKDCGDGCPVDKVSWHYVQWFISELNQMEGTTKYRLPTEAEWEYASRAGTTTAFSFGNEVGELGRYAWYMNNSGSQTHPVGKKKPNVWGLYDMHGNVWEWCQDWYGDYPTGPITDPKGPDSGKYRVLRGGSWDNYSGYLRSALRRTYDPGYRDYFIGFRVARDF